MKKISNIMMFKVFKFGIMAAIIFSIFFLTGYSNDSNNLKDPNNQDIRAMDVDRIINMLEKENLDKSLSMLLQVQLYYPGEMSMANEGQVPKIPLDSSAGRIDVSAILSNRRFLKVLKELSNLPKEQADQKVCQHLKVAIETYNKTFKKYMKDYGKVLEENRKNPERGKPIGFISYVSDGRITLKAIRYKVLAIVLIAGQLNLPESGKYVNEVLEIALEQRKTFYNTDAFTPSNTVIMLEGGSLYNRQILAMALLGTHLPDEYSQKILQQNSKKITDYKLTSYNAAATPFERSLRAMGTDYSKGSINVKIIEPLNDSEFDKIVESVKAQKSNPPDSNEPK